MTKNTGDQTKQAVDSNTLISQYPDHPVLINRIEMAKGFHDASHSHDWHQVLYPSSGLLKTRTDSHHFYIPHHRALFIPAGVSHASDVIREATFIGLYLNPSQINALPKVSQPIEVSPFFRALILKLVQAVDPDQPITQPLLNLLAVFADELRAKKDSALELPMPADRRLQPIVNALIEQPDSQKTLQTWAEETGATERTLSRLFKKEIHLTFPQWRQRLRLMSSLSLLEKGDSVQNVAHQIGYQSVSAFIEAFRLAFKQTPQQFKTESRQQAAY
ncbi:helix-turn-helix domain-containing protein [Photobacterium sp. 1_MG-2023]|uniref:AraC family transcriptional regulator n=1 Tax=Photobacterium sp. 1_MG-2023 TaxID=3062646 RepID=UPI0026E1ECE5|nr:helix-turn-helix transcriptional regulator [Photobacterium sp. 1_MG-2023]MDO6708182.1 helix-turn-helix transcriptional regulator [Photobacterium sp. 1_MG-2023]